MPLLPILKRMAIFAIFNLLAFFRRIRWGNSKGWNEVKDIVLFQFGGIGDMVLATPALKTLEAHFPHAKITILCSDEPFGRFLLRFANVREVRDFNIYALDTRTLFRKASRSSLRAMLKYLRERRFDLLINLHIPALIDWWAVELFLVATSGARIKIGFNPAFLKMGSFYDFYLSEQERSGRHYTELFALLFERAGLPGDRTTVFPLEDGDREAAKRLLRQNGVEENRALICLHPGGRRLLVESKLWPVSFFTLLAKRLVEQGFTVVVLGVPGEEQLGEQIGGAGVGCYNVVGKTTLLEMAALIKGTSLFIGNDSGPFHIAVATGTKALGICGRPDAEPHYYQYRRREVAVLVKPAPELITVEEVLAKARELLEGSAVQPR